MEIHGSNLTGYIFVTYPPCESIFNKYVWIQCQILCNFINFIAPTKEISVRYPNFRWVSFWFRLSHTSLSQKSISLLLSSWAVGALSSLNVTVKLPQLDSLFWSASHLNFPPSPRLDLHNQKNSNRKKTSLKIHAHCAKYLGIIGEKTLSDKSDFFLYLKIEWQNF